MCYYAIRKTKTNISKYIALVLRHKPEEANLTLNKEVPVKYLSPGDSFYN